MKSKWYWLLLALLWFAVAAANAWEHRTAPEIWFAALGGVIFLALGICQLVCDKKGEAGRRALRVIRIVALILVAAATVAALLVSLL